MDKTKVEYLWKDRKRNFLGLPWSFTKYRLSKDRLFVEKGVLSTREDEVRLYRIVSLTMTRNLWQKLIGTGTIHLDSTDQAMRNFDIRNVKHPHDVKEKLSELIEVSRKENRAFGENPRFQIQLDQRPLSPRTSREAGGVPCLNPRTCFG